MDTDNIYVQYANLPTKIKGFVKSNQDGSCTIMLNARHSSEQNKSTLDHEIRHIKNGDYDDVDASVDTIEIKARKKE